MQENSGLVSEDLIATKAPPQIDMRMSQAAIVHIIDDDESQRETLVSLLGSVDLKGRAYPSVAAFLTAAQYNTYVRDFFLNGIPNDINGAITGSAGTISAASFDHVWNKAFGGGWVVWKNTSCGVAADTPALRCRIRSNVSACIAKSRIADSEQSRS